MITLYFTKRFDAGLLKGLHYHDQISFPDCAAMDRWLTGISKNAKRIGWHIVDKSFQKYAR